MHNRYFQANHKKSNMYTPGTAYINHEQRKLIHRLPVTIILETLKGLGHEIELKYFFILLASVFPDGCNLIPGQIVQLQYELTNFKA
jgi:hypothetical protein